VFGTKGEWKKTGLYQSVAALVNGQVVHNIFSQTDEAKHAEEKKPIAKYYSPAGVASFEPLIDKTIAQLCGELDKRFVATAASAVDLGDWILYYAWDVVGTVTFSQPFGYLSAGRDFDGTLRASDKTLDYFSWVGCMPFFDTLLQKNRVAAYITTKFFRSSGGFNAIAATCVNRLIARYQGTDRQSHSPSQPDYLDRFLEIKAAGAGDSAAFPVDDNRVVSWIMVNLGAGADTTAISIRSALYYSLRTPGVWARLRAELASAGLFDAENFSGEPVSLKQARRVPYLEAVVREAIRYLPGVSLGIERYVPPGGQRLPCAGNRVVPQGTILAFNPWIINRNKSVFGPDSHEFRPERWLRGEGEGEAEFAARLRAMNDADLSFGAGSRMCIGKHFGIMQVFKVVATLALRYDIELVNPEKQWTVINSWFPRQKGLVVRMRKRSG
jgi:cytochrome P450